MRAGAWPYESVSAHTSHQSLNRTLEGSKMSSWGVTRGSDAPARRIRDEVKDGAAVVAASAVVSTLLAVGLMLLTKLAG